LFASPRPHMFGGMVGKGSPGVLGVFSFDPVLSAIAPLGLAAAAGTCLVLDLRGDLHIPHARTLADVAIDGPRLDELSPGRPGVAVMSVGALGLEEARRVVDELATRWPAVVIRTAPEDWSGRKVPVVPLLPGWAAPQTSGAAVWQPVAAGSAPPGPGPVLPRLRSRTVRTLLAGRLPTRSRWVRAWSRVWELPWA
jgi:hypothetical protein